MAKFVHTGVSDLSISFPKAWIKLAHAAKQMNYEISDLIPDYREIDKSLQ